MFALRSPVDTALWHTLSETISEMWRHSEPAGVEDLDACQWTDISKKPRAAPSIFGCREYSLGEPHRFFTHRHPAPDFNRDKTEVIRAWRRMTENLRAFGVRGQIAGLHAYIDALRDPAPIAALARSKAWTAPVGQAVGSMGPINSALAKYVSFRYLAYHPSRLRLVWVRDTDSEETDVVLTITLDGRTFLLGPDGATITTDERADRRRPVVSLNCRSLWLHWDDATGDTAGNAVERFKRLFGVDHQRAI